VGSAKLEQCRELLYPFATSRRSYDQAWDATNRHERPTALDERN